MQYFYTVKITNNRELNFVELSLDQYKNLQKICIESDFNKFKEYINKLIIELCVDDINFELNLIDIFIIILKIRLYSISDEKNLISYDKNKKGIKTIYLEDLINKVYDKYDELNDDTYSLTLDDYIVDEVIINPFDIDHSIVAFRKDNNIIPYTSDMYELLPVNIINDIYSYINYILDKYKDVILFTLCDEHGNKNNILFELEEKFVYDFLRIILREDLKELYKNLYDIKRNLKINFDEHKNLTYSEMELYITMFNEEQKKLEDENNDTPSGLPNM